MAISQKVGGMLEKASWIRKMFEEGIRLKQEFGEENVFDLSLGNTVVEPPPELREALINAARDERPGLHRYMPTRAILTCGRPSPNRFHRNVRLRCRKTT